MPSLVTFIHLFSLLATTEHGRSWLKSTRHLAGHYVYVNIEARMSFAVQSCRPLSLHGGCPVQPGDGAPGVLYLDVENQTTTPPPRAIRRLAWANNEGIAQKKMAHKSKLTPFALATCIHTPSKKIEACGGHPAGHASKGLGCGPARTPHQN